MAKTMPKYRFSYNVLCEDCDCLHVVQTYYPIPSLSGRLGDRHGFCSSCQSLRDAEQDDEQAWESFHAGPFERDPGADF